MNHPVEAYGYRVEADGAVLAFTGDTDDCDALTPLLHGADLVLADSAFVDGRDAVPGIHLSGSPARPRPPRGPGASAGSCSPTSPRGTTARCAAPRRRPYWPGEVELAEPGAVYAVRLRSSAGRRRSPRSPGRASLAAMPDPHRDARSDDPARRPLTRPAREVADHPELARPRRGQRPRRVRPHPGAVRRVVHRGRAALAQGPGTGWVTAEYAMLPRVDQHPQRPRVASRAGSAAAPTRSPGSSGAACAPSSTPRRWARTRSCSTVTCCRPTAAPGPRPSPAPTSRWSTPSRTPAPGPAVGEGAAADRVDRRRQRRPRRRASRCSTSTTPRTRPPTPT